MIGLFFPEIFQQSLIFFDFDIFCGFPCISPRFSILIDTNPFDQILPFPPRITFRSFFISSGFYLRILNFFISSSSNSSSSSDPDDWSASDGGGDGSAFRSGDFFNLLFGAIFDGFLEVDSFLFAKNLSNSSAPSFSINSRGSQVSSHGFPSSFNPCHFIKYSFLLLNNSFGIYNSLGNQNGSSIP